MFEVKFNGKKIPSFIKVQSVNKTLLPNIETYSRKKPLVLGEFFSSIDFGTREIKLNISLLCNTLSKYYIDTVATWLKGNDWKPSKLQLDDTGDYYNAVCTSNLDIEDLLIIGKGEIVFTCFDPLLYSDQESSVKIFDNTTNVINAGNQSVYPTLEIITENYSNLSIENLATKQKLEIDGNFKLGQKLVIDCKRGYITLDDNNYMKGFVLRSDWIQLKQGFNSIKVNTNTNSVGEVIIKFVPCWI